MAYSWRAEIQKEAKGDLDSLAESLGFIVEGFGRYAGGRPSPVQLLDALAAVYRRDPALVTRTLAALGVRPEKKPAPPTTATAPPSP